MHLDLSHIARNLEFSEAGRIWKSRTRSAVRYPEEGNEHYFSVEDASFWFRHRNECILAVVRSFPPAGTFFDVGGGNGYVARALQDAGTDIVLVEPGSAGARNARQRGITNIVHSTLQDADFAPGTLPAVGLFDVLEHIQDDCKFLRDIHSLLTPNGRLYLSVPGFQWLWSYEDDHAGHCRRYTRPSLSTLLEQSGYLVEYATYFFSFLVGPIFLIRALPYRTGFRRDKDRKTAIQSDHVPNRLLNRVLGTLARRELSRIASGKTLMFGGSCMLVARKL